MILIRPLRAFFICMNINQNEISGKIKEAVAELGYLLVDIEFKGQSKDSIIGVFVDNKIGVTTEDCVRISRILGDLIEDQNLIDSKYRLNVSSPGVDRPLKFIEQYTKNINKELEVTYAQNEQTKNIVARLNKIEGNNLFFEFKKEVLVINFDDIKIAKVLISFGKRR